MNTNTTLAYQAFTNCRVSGMYNGVPFKGIVTGRRWHTSNPNTVLVWVDLDTPLTIFGHTRNGICLEYNDTDYLADQHYIDYIDPTTYPNKERAL